MYIVLKFAPPPSQKWLNFPLNLIWHNIIKHNILFINVLDDLPSNDKYSVESLPKLIVGDSVYITIFYDVHHIFVRKIEEYEDEIFENFIAKVDSYCSAGTNQIKLYNIDLLLFIAYF